MKNDECNSNRQSTGYSYVEIETKKSRGIMGKILLTLISLCSLPVVLILLIIIGFVATFGGCTTYRVTYECMYDSEKIESIVLYDLKSGAESVEDFGVPCAVIQESQYDEFMKEIEKMPFEDMLILVPVPTDPNFSFYGDVIKVSYENGAYELISSNGVQKQINENGDKRYTHYSCDENVWSEFISNYYFDE